MGNWRPILLKNALAFGTDDAALSEVLNPLVRERFGNQARASRVAAEQVERRLIRYTIQIADAGDGASREWRIFGKLYGARPQMERGYEMMQHLWANGFSCAATDRIGIPEPMRCLPDLCLLLMPEVQGAPLRHLIKDMRATPDHMRLMAEALAKLQRSPIIAKPPLSVEAQLSHCNPSPEVLAQAYPDLVAAIAEIMSRARFIANDFGDKIYTLIHGDFHLGHALIDDRQVWLLDFDQLNCGDPAYDVAEVFAFFKRSAKKTKMADYLAGLKDTFIANYFSRMGWEIAGRVPLYEALLHLKRACKCYRVQDESGWEEQMRLLIAQAVTCLNVMEKQSGPFDFNKAAALYRNCPGIA